MRGMWNPTGPRVVVADDDPDIRDLVSHVLRDVGYNVQKAMDVPTAMHCLHFPGVAAAILDMLFVNSGGRSGLDLLRYMRGTPRLEKVPVIVITGFFLNRSVVADIEALHAEVWHKPVYPLDLVQRLNHLLYHRAPGR